MHAEFIILQQKYCSSVRGYNQAKPLQETGSQKGNFNWNSKTEINSLLGIQHTHASNFNNFQSVLQFHRFSSYQHFLEFFLPKQEMKGTSIQK